MYTLLKKCHKANHGGSCEDYQKAIVALGAWVYSLWYKDTLHIDSKYARASLYERNRIEKEAKSK